MMEEQEVSCYCRKKTHAEVPTYRSFSDSYSAQLRALFWIAVSNFVFPVFFDIALYILIFRAAAHYSAYLIVLITNIYVEIIGVLFATVWAATKHSKSPGPTIANAETLQFARNMAFESGTLDSGVGVNNVCTDDSIGFDKGERSSVSLASQFSIRKTSTVWLPVLLEARCARRFHTTESEWRHNTLPKS
jgi:hypothetical protein